MQTKISFILNGEKVSIETHGLRRLLDVLREDFDLVGIKEGCGEGECGACAILLNGKLTNACLVAIGTIEGSEVLTIEGFRGTDRFNILETTFSEVGAVQCGFCTPGMIMAGEALLRKNSSPNETEVREAISGNLCRCTGYNMIVEAIILAAKRGDGLW